MGIYDVTQEQYQQVMGNNPSQFKGAQNPVEMVSWDDAADFCKKLSAKTGTVVQLPTEAQWEYACRAGTKAPFNTGETINTDQANFDGNYTYGNGAKGDYRQKTTTVGSFKPNAFGLYDMHGNVCQWCADWFEENYYGRSPKADPTGPADGTLRVLRGGSWNGRPWYCRSALRSGASPGARDGYGGFRVVVGVD
jgi:formylglycine-generating enzyme required for sulfatase activity